MPVYAFACDCGHSFDQFFHGSPPEARARADRGVACGRCGRVVRPGIQMFHAEARWRPQEDIASGQTFTTARERDQIHKEKGLVYIGRERGA